MTQVQVKTVSAEDSQKSKNSVSVHPEVEDVSPPEESKTVLCKRPTTLPISSDNEAGGLDKKTGFFCHL